MGVYHFIVAVHTENSEYAAEVMAERLNHDEDYGFRYSVEWDWDNS